MLAAVGTAAAVSACAGGQAPAARGAEGEEPGPGGAVPAQATYGALALALDRDADGTVSESELDLGVQRAVARRVRQRFSTLDRDGNGYLARSELRGMKYRRFAHFDLNHDERISLGELGQVMGRLASRQVRQLFVELDADRDGQFDGPELVAYRTLLRSRQGEEARQPAVARETQARRASER